MSTTDQNEKLVGQRVGWLELVGLPCGCPPRRVQGVPRTAVSDAASAGRLLDLGENGVCCRS